MDDIFCCNHEYTCGRYKPASFFIRADTYEIAVTISNHDLDDDVYIEVVNSATCAENLTVGSRSDVAFCIAVNTPGIDIHTLPIRKSHEQRYFVAHSSESLHVPSTASYTS